MESSSERNCTDCLTSCELLSDKPRPRKITTRDSDTSRTMEIASKRAVFFDALLFWSFLMSIIAVSTRASPLSGFTDIRPLLLQHPQHHRSSEFITSLRLLVLTDLDQQADEPQHASVRQSILLIRLREPVQFFLFRIGNRGSRRHLTA